MNQFRIADEGPALVEGHWHVYLLDGHTMLFSGDLAGQAPVHWLSDTNRPSLEAISGENSDCNEGT